MLAAIRKRLARDEEGFTLIELMVVVLIIAILIAIAVPTFLGARQRAQARSAQSNVRNAFSAAKVFFTDNETYSTNATAGTATSLITELGNIEPSMTYNTAVAAANPKQIAVRVANTSTGTVNGVVCLSSKGADGKIYTLRDISNGANPGVSYHTEPDGTAALPACDTTTAYGTKW